MPHVGYSRDERIRVAQQIVEHAWRIALNGGLCVVATISLFTEIHEANRGRSNRLKLPLLVSLIESHERMRHDRRPHLNALKSNVVGIDIAAELPHSPNHYYINDGSMEALLTQVTLIRDLWSNLIAQTKSKHE